MQSSRSVLLSRSYGYRARITARKLGQVWKHDGCIATLDKFHWTAWQKIRTLQFDNQPIKENEMKDKAEVRRGREWFILFMLGWIFCALLPALPAEAALDCSLDATAGLNPEYGATGNTFASIPAGYTITSMGESNTNKIFKQVKSSSHSLINGADGGCVIGNYARPSGPKGASCWANMPKSADVVWMKPINRSKGIDPNVYVATLEQDIVGALTEISKQVSGVKEVWMSGHHATPYVTSRNPPKQAEPYSHDAIFAIQNVIAKYQGAWGFKLVLGPYLWANANKPRADGLQWNCADFDPDGVHLSSGGYRKAADLMVGNSTPPPPDVDPPPPEPEQCPVPGWAERKGYTCSWNERQERCVCRP